MARNQTARAAATLEPVFRSSRRLHRSPRFRASVVPADREHMRLAAVAALVALLGLTGCGSHRSVPASRPPAAKPSPEPQLTGNRNVRADLPALMRALVPPGERATLSPDELKVNECGISPTFPCMNAFFSVAKGRAFAVRLHRLRALAVGNGWQVVR